MFIVLHAIQCENPQRYLTTFVHQPKVPRNYDPSLFEISILLKAHFLFFFFGVINEEKNF